MRGCGCQSLTSYDDIDNQESLPRSDVEDTREYGAVVSMIVVSIGRL